MLCLATACGTVPSSAGDELMRTDWHLVEAGGIEIPSDDRWLLSFDGEGRFSLDGCNTSGGEVEVSGSRIGPAGEVAGTAIGCSGEAGQLDELVLGLVDGADWSIAGDRLELRGDEHRASFERRGLEWPRTMEHVLLEVDGPTGPQYQVGWSATPSGGGAIGYHGRDDPYGPWGSAGSVVDTAIGRGPNNPFFVEHKDRLLVFGPSHARTSKAEYRPSDGDVTPLEVYDLPGGRKVFAGEVRPFVPGRAFGVDDAGAELHRSRVYESNVP